MKKCSICNSENIRNYPFELGFIPSHIINADITLPVNPKFNICMDCGHVFITDTAAVETIKKTYDEFDYLDYKCPKRGEITEFIVTNKVRSQGIGQKLINKMEEYFKVIGCEYIIVDVFAYNEIAKNFYSKNEYYPREEIRIKKIIE